MIEPKNYNVSAIRDALRNLSVRENGDNHEYAKGLVVGMVATLCATHQLMYEEAISFVANLSPFDCHAKRIPAQMLAEFRDKIAAHTR